ncbi:MAG TPA: 30S ribosomal protein S13 [Chthonomonadaceae bacterium]|nr:30S ribosomal protein S13 [Chthonomonadaceae bacterium]
MARIAGVDLPRDKRIEYALTYIYGIGLPSAQKIVVQAGINPNTRVREMTEAETAKVREILEREYRVEGDLRREFALSVRRLIEIGCYRGMRHRRGLPTRGQRTKTNARIRKGPKRTVAGKKKAKK